MNELKNATRFGTASELPCFLHRVRPLPLLLGVMVVLTLPIPCPAQSASPAQSVHPPTLTPAQRSAALAGAKGLVGKLAQTKSLAGMAGILTNRSAAGMGMAMSGMLGMGIAMGGKLSGDTGQSPSGLSASQLKSDYAAFLKRWGLSETEPVPTPGQSVPMPGKPRDLSPAVAKDGRGFLRDVAALMNKIGMEEHVSPGPADTFSARDVTYTVLSPTRVRLGMKPGKKEMPPAEAVLEGGQWRLDLGNLVGAGKPASAPTPPPHF